jgi:large subunit ribosomal protein L27
MSKVKAGGSSKNNRNNIGARLGVKRFGGQKVSAGEVIVRQTGASKVAGEGTYLSRNFTIHAAKDGIVSFRKVKVRRFTGKTAPRTQVMIVDAPAPKTTAKAPAAK